MGRRYRLDFGRYGGELRAGAVDVAFLRHWAERDTADLERHVSALEWGGDEGDGLDPLSPPLRAGPDAASAAALAGPGFGGESAAGSTPAAAHTVVPAVVGESGAGATAAAALAVVQGAQALLAAPEDVCDVYDVCEMEHCSSVFADFECTVTELAEGDDPHEYAATQPRCHAATRPHRPHTSCALAVHRLVYAHANRESGEQGSWRVLLCAPTGSPEARGCAASAAPAPAPAGTRTAAWR